MPDFAEPLARLILEIKRLPGIGQKSAQRIAFHVLRSKREDVDRLVQALIDVKEKLGICSVCNNISDAEVCSYCRDASRDQSVICVLEEPYNILPIETTRQFHGLYHVLHGAISPLRGIGPEQLRIKSLLHRIENGAVQEVILLIATLAAATGMRAHTNRIPNARAGPRTRRPVGPNDESRSAMRSHSGG